MKKFAVVCASGVGDALLMQIAANHLRNLGIDVVTFACPPMKDLADWFPGFTFLDQPKVEEIEKQFDSFDGIILQHDNSEKSKLIHALAKPVYTLYGSHFLPKHGPMRAGFDVKFDPSICMAENISYAMQTLFPEGESDLANGITPPPHLIHRRFPNRIVITPTSGSPLKNWPKNSFYQLYDQLEEAGWEPVFVVPPEETEEWGANALPLLSDLANFIYESSYLIGNDSGPGHLASNLGIPTVIIGPSKEHLTFWRPGWHRGELAHPPNWTTKIKITKEKWKLFVSLNRVIKQFKKLTDIK